MKTLIIAEIGVNHNGSISLAKKLIDKAKKAKVDYVKFQSFISGELVTKKSKLAPYQKKTNKKNQFSLLKKLELSFNKQTIIINYCKKKKINFISTPFDEKSLKFLSQKKIPIIKISSTDLGNLPLLKKVAKLKKKVFLSTGMSSVIEIELSINELLSNGLKKDDITLMHCHSAYPTKFKDINLNTILFLKKKFNLDIGFSDHTPGIEASLGAVVLGARVIEKHFTIDKKMNGPDHASSLSYDELCMLVKGIRNIEKSLGVEKKVISKIEKKNKLSLKKSIVASKNINKDEYFSENNLTTKRPGTGIPSYKWHKVIGKKAKKNFTLDEQIVL